MRLAAGPTPAPPTASTTRGQEVFTNVGCNLCISRNMLPQVDLQQSEQCNIFSVQRRCSPRHGAELTDGIVQGNVTGGEFHTAPLWGIGQRLFFLHDGRTSNLYQAITAHAGNGFEGNAVVANFEMLSAADQQALFEFPAVIVSVAARRCVDGGPVISACFGSGPVIFRVHHENVRMSK